MLFHFTVYLCLAISIIEEIGSNEETAKCTIEMHWWIDAILDMPRQIIIVCIRLSIRVHPQSLAYLLLNVITVKLLKNGKLHFNLELEAYSVKCTCTASCRWMISCENYCYFQRISTCMTAEKRTPKAHTNIYTHLFEWPILPKNIFNCQVEVA